MRKWPKISIVTPSYNQARFLEETILSVINQNYPNLEYIIIDGGSADNSKEIIKKYESYLTYWVSEKDLGQSNAINKGFKKASGDIFGWINSDDYYYPGSFEVVAKAFLKNKKLDFVHGFEDHVNLHGKVICKYYPAFKSAKLSTIYSNTALLQLTCFWKSSCFGEVGGLDENLHMSMDFDLLIKLSKNYKSKYINYCIGAFRRYPEQKSDINKMLSHGFNEQFMVWERLVSQYKIPVVLWKMIIKIFYYFLRLKSAFSKI